MRQRLVKLPGKGAHAHWRVADVAKGIAREVYDSWASRSDEFYKEHRSLEAYVESCWALYLDAARRTLAQLLGAHNLDETQKAEIHEALVLDATLRRGREGVIQMKKGKGA